jgi:hypothetical protein
MRFTVPVRSSSSRNQTRSGRDERQEDQRWGCSPRVARFDAVQLGRNEPSERHRDVMRASRPDPWSMLKDTLGAVAGTGGSLFLRRGAPRF